MLYYKVCRSYKECFPLPCVGEGFDENPIFGFLTGWRKLCPIRMRGAFFQSSGSSGGGPWCMCSWPVALHPTVECVSTHSDKMCRSCYRVDFPNHPNHLLYL